MLWLLIGCVLFGLVSPALGLMCGVPHLLLWFCCLDYDVQPKSRVPNLWDWEFQLWHSSRMWASSPGWWTHSVTDMWLYLAWCLPESFHFGLPWTLPLQHLACCFSPFTWTLRFAQSTKFPRPETTAPHPGIKGNLLHGCDLPFQGGGQAVTQEALGLGWLGWAGSNNAYGPHLLDIFNDLGGIQQVACAERCLLALTRNGKVYSMFYSSDTQVGCLSVVVGMWLHLWVPVIMGTWLHPVVCCGNLVTSLSTCCCGNLVTSLGT